MVPHLPAGGVAGLPALRTGRSGIALHDGAHRSRTRPGRQRARPQMGVHLHDARHLRRRVLRLLPVILLDIVRRRILRLDGHSAGLRRAGRLLRIPPQTVQRTRPTHLRGLSGTQRRGGAAAAGRRRGHILHRRGVHRQPHEHGRRGRRHGHIAMGDAVARSRSADGRTQSAAGSSRLRPFAGAGAPLFPQQSQRRDAAAACATPVVRLFAALSGRVPRLLRVAATAPTVGRSTLPPAR